MDTSFKCCIFKLNDYIAIYGNQSVFHKSLYSILELTPYFLPTLHSQIQFKPRMLG